MVASVSERIPLPVQVAFHPVLVFGSAGLQADEALRPDQALQLERLGTRVRKRFFPDVHPSGRIFKEAVADQLGRVPIGFRIGVGMEDLRAQGAEEAFHPVLASLSAHRRIVVGQVLRDIDGRDPTAARRGLVGGIVFVQEVLRFVGPEEHRPGIARHVALFHRPLPDVFEENLAVPADFVIDLDRQIEEQDLAPQAIVGRDRGAVVAEQGVDRLAEQAVEEAGERKVNDRARFLAEVDQRLTEEQSDEAQQPVVRHGLFHRTLVAAGGRQLLPLLFGQAQRPGVQLEADAVARSLKGLVKRRDPFFLLFHCQGRVILRHRLHDVVQLLDRHRVVRQPAQVDDVEDQHVEGRFPEGGVFTFAALLIARADHGFEHVHDVLGAGLACPATGRLKLQKIEAVRAARFQHQQILRAPGEAAVFFPLLFLIWLDGQHQAAEARRQVLQGKCSTGPGRFTGPNPPENLHALHRVADRPVARSRASGELK